MNGTLGVTIMSKKQSAVQMAKEWEGRTTLSRRLLLGNEMAEELYRLEAANAEMLRALVEAEPMLSAMLKQISDHLPTYQRMPALDQVRSAIAKHGESL
jgi:hypothetical protein